MPQPEEAGQAGPSHMELDIVDLSRLQFAMTALYHFLVRYSIGGARPSLVEEIVPVACDLVTGSFPGEEEAAGLDRVEMVPLPPGREASVKKHLVRALAEDTWSSIFAERIEARRQELVAEREALREQLAAVYPDPGWLSGAAEISVASHDLISLRLLEPVPTAEVRR